MSTEFSVDRTDPRRARDAKSLELLHAPLSGSKEASCYIWKDPGIRTCPNIPESRLKGHF
jgi:hypothetical protein